MLRLRKLRKLEERSCIERFSAQANIDAMVAETWASPAKAACVSSGPHRLAPRTSLSRPHKNVFFLLVASHNLTNRG